MSLIAFAIEVVFLIFAKAGVFDVPANMPLVKIMLVKVKIHAFLVSSLQFIQLKFVLIIM